ncbi:MAG: hypothetical protein WCA38_15495 [Candidatus Acidiferrales bacterium]
MPSFAMEKAARDVLGGFGDATLGEWTQDRPQAFHLRRRLSAFEQARIGDAVDLRGKPEANERFMLIKELLPPQAIALAQEELAEWAAT